MATGLPIIEEWLRLQEILVPFLVRCGAAALCGGMIGLERELRKKPAGFRTNILVALGALVVVFLVYAALAIVFMLLDQITNEYRKAKRKV